MGAIEAGVRCDIVVLDPDHPALIGRCGDEPSIPGCSPAARLA
jgi:cytosine/adenosine deaminase-related metal-dependent hydrolase